MFWMPWHDLLRSGDPGTPRIAAGPTIRALAGLQHGVVARWQLRRLGVGAHAIRDRVARGELIVLWPGVYALGHAALSGPGTHMSAVLAAGEHTALSLRHAGATHGLRPTSAAWIDVTRAGGPRTVAGVRVHLTRRWHPDDVVIVDGVPVTAVCRTIVDLSDVVTDQGLDSILARAEAAQLDVSGLDAAVARVRGRRGPGPARLRAARERIAAYGAVLTRSEGEVRLRELLTQAGLPDPVMNLPIGGDELDAGWPALRAGIELDSWEFHNGRVRFVRDRAKLRRMTLAGWTILRFSGHDLVHRPGLVLRETGQLLSRAPAAARPARCASGG
jgi:hypothetical protein